RIDLVGIHEEGLPEEEWLDDTRRIVRLRIRTGGPRGLGRLAFLARWNWEILQYYRETNVGVVNAHIVWALPSASVLKRRAQGVLIYDTHELETETIGSRGLRKHLSKAIEARFVRHADAIFVVSDSIHEWYAARVGSTVAVRTFKNYPYRRTRAVESRVIPDELGIPPNELVFLYQGQLSRAPEIDLLLEAHAQLPSNRHLVFMGFGSRVDELRARARSQSNLHFVPAVPFQDVPRYTGSADVGIALFRDACLSYRFVLPNKLLESLAAGIPVIVSDLPDMRREVKDGALGWVVQNQPGALSQLMLSIDRGAVDARAAQLQDWSAHHCWEDEAERMLDVYRRLLKE
ncbi:MAG: glycosyltransferase, partial [Dehalococcoidia bacterium]